MSTTSQSAPTRRGFLKKITATAAAGAGVAVAPVGARSALAARKVQYGMLIDASRCIGCQACSVACKTEYGVPLGTFRAWVDYVEYGAFPEVKRGFRPRLCNQCDDPACVAACPHDATYKRTEDGVVWVDPVKCRGAECALCVSACPYEARFINPATNVADKCTFCLHRVQNGVQPACVETCMGRARVFGDVNDPESEISRRIAAERGRVSVYMPDAGTGPNVYYVDAPPEDADETRPGGYGRVDANHRSNLEA